MYMCVYIYIYIYVERERCVYIYIYIYIYIGDEAAEAAEANVRQWWRSATGFYLSVYLSLSLSLYIYIYIHTYIYIYIYVFRSTRQEQQRLPRLEATKRAASRPTEE